MAAGSGAAPAGSSASGSFRRDLEKIKPKVLPLFSRLLKMIEPPSAMITFLAMNKPSPVPSGRALRALAAR